MLWVSVEAVTNPGCRTCSAKCRWRGVAKSALGRPKWYSRCGVGTWKWWCWGNTPYAAAMKAKHDCLAHAVYSIVIVVNGDHFS